MYSAVVSPSTFGFVATTTSSTPPSATRAEKLSHAKLFRPDAVDRGDGALQHMVLSPELTRTLDRYKIAWFLDNADDRGIPL